MSKLKVVLVLVVDEKDANDITLGLSELSMRIRAKYKVPNWSVATFSVEDHEGVRRFVRTTKLGQKRL